MLFIAIIYRSKTAVKKQPQVSTRSAIRGVGDLVRIVEINTYDTYIDTNILLNHTIKVKKKEVDLSQSNKIWHMCENGGRILAKLKNADVTGKIVPKKQL